MNKKGDSAKTVLFKQIANGLRERPAYLLIFGVCALFFVSGLGNSIAGAIKSDHFLVALGLISFIVSLAAAVYVVKNIEGISPEYILNLREGKMEDSADVQGRDSLAFSDTIVESFPRELDSDFEKAKEIWLLGIHLSHILIRHHHEIEKKLIQGCHFRVLLTDPEGAACEMTALRFPGQVRVEQERQRILSSLTSFYGLKKIAPERLEIRIIDFLLPYGGYILDPNDSSGIVYIQRYTFRKQGGPRKPKLIYRNKDGFWYELVCGEVRELWKAAQPWRCSAETE